MNLRSTPKIARSVRRGSGVASAALAEIPLVFGGSLVRMGDEFYIYYFGCPNTYNSWPAQHAVAPERRGAWFAPVFLGLATLPRDRFAFATGNGVLTTHPLEVGREGLWLNADGNGLSVTALDSRGQIKARGALGTERRQTVYRKVVWQGSAPTGPVRVQVELTSVDRLYSLAC
jgi:hypothetical protein